MVPGSGKMKFIGKMLNTTSASVVILNASEEITWINNAFKGCFGYCLADLKGNSLQPFLPVEYEEKFKTMIHHAFLGNSIEAFDIPMTCSDNTIKAIRWNTMLIHDDDPKQETVAVFGVEKDRADRIKSDLEIVEERYRLLFENTGISMMFIGEDTTIVLINKEFEKLTGYTKDQVEGKMQWTELIAHEEDIDRMKNFHRLRRIDPTLAPSVYDTIIKTSGGDMRNNMFRVTMIPGTTYSLVSMVDMTERILAESALRESEEKYRSLVDNMQNTLYRCDCKGNLTYMSPSGARVLGYDSVKELIGENIAKCFYYNPGERALLLNELKTSGKVADYEVILKHKDGSPLIASTNSQFFYDKEGNILGVEGIFSDITKRKQAEDSVRSSRKFLNDILQAASEFSIIATTPDGIITSFNRGVELMLGYSADEMIGKQSVLTIHNKAEVSERGRELTSKLGYPVEGFRVFVTKSELGGTETREWTYVRKDGTSLLVSLVATPVYSDDDKIIGYLGIANDITKKRQMEKTLQENEERLRGITNNIPGAIFQLYAKDNCEYGISYVSERLTEIFGLPADLDTLFPAFISRLYKEDRERFMISVQKAMESCNSWNFEGRFVNPSGEITWFHGLATPIRHEDRIVFNGILLNITERKKAEEMLRQSEDKFSKIFMTTPDCVAITRMIDGLFIDVNLGFEEISGWKRSEAIGRTSCEIKLWVDPSERDLLVEDLKDGRDVIQREFQFRLKDGSLRIGIYSAKSIRIAEELCIIFVMQDITDIRRIEEERHNMEQYLYHSQKMDAIGQLAGGLAHDFNNILMGIQSNASLLLMEHNPDDPCCQRLSRIEDHVKRGANLTRQLLGFARGAKYDLKTLYINNVLRKSAEFYIETRKDIDADFQLQTDVYQVEGDSGQIEQVLLNIYINAGHAMPEGGHLHIQTVNLTLQEKDTKALNITPGNYVKISISDTGIGMDAETLRRIFEPFFTTKSKQGGTGLGLASAYGIIRNHGGAINAHSEPGHGSTFNIYLPSSVKKAEREERIPGKRIVYGSGGILLVDDESMILDTTTELLKRLGYTVYKAGSGQEAIFTYRENQNRIDLVILDIILPGMSGLYVLRMLRDINTDVKVILSSGYSLQDEVQDHMEMEYQGFIQKPYDSAGLSNIVRHALYPSQ